jgi:carboxylesterase type B
LSADEQQLADTMKTYWANFVRTRDPNFPRPVPAWLPFNGTDAVQHLIPAPQIPHPFFTFEREHVCRTWQPIIATETPK